MKNQKAILRRDFLRIGAGSLAAATLLPVLNSEKANAQTSQGQTLVESEIEFNHGHLFLIQLETLQQFGARAYSIQGASSHTHTLMINEDHLLALGNGETVTLSSSVDAGHDHTVQLRGDKMCS